MSELEDTADHLVVIGRGRLIADTSRAPTSSPPPQTTVSASARRSARS